MRVGCAGLSPPPGIVSFSRTPHGTYVPSTKVPSNERGSSSSIVADELRGSGLAASTCETASATLSIAHYPCTLVGGGTRIARMCVNVRQCKRSRELRGPRRNSLHLVGRTPPDPGSSLRGRASTIPELSSRTSRRKAATERPDGGRDAPRSRSGCTAPGLVRPFDLQPPRRSKERPGQPRCNRDVAFLPVACHARRAVPKHALRSPG